MYEAKEFELALTIRDVEVSIRPEIVEVIANGNDYPVIDRVLDDHGLVIFVLAHDLVNAHADGDITIRQFASLTGLSTGTTYDLVKALYDIPDLSSDSSQTTYTPDDVVDEDDGLRDKSLTE